jgi:hypothetical protein
MKKFFTDQFLEINENTKNVRHQKTLSDLREAALELNPKNLFDFDCDVSKNCCNAGRCIKQTSIGDFVMAQMAFWGEQIISSKISRSTFENRIDQIFKVAKFEKGNFQFIISPGHYICERAILFGLGLSENQNLSKAPSAWLKIKKKYIFAHLSVEEKIKYETDERVKLAEKVGKGRATTKTDSCNQFIFEMINEYTGIADTTAFAVSKDDEDPLYIPYTDIKSFYEEYVWFCQVSKSAHNMGSIKTFGKAWRKLKNVKLLTSKGAFKTCDFCSNCHDFLRNRNQRWTTEMIEIVLKVKRDHIKQQQEARLKMALDMMNAKKLDSKGQPITAFIEPDGVSTWLGNCPKVGKGPQNGMSQEDKIINRTIGIDFVCGPIEGKMLFHTDNFVPHGGNVMVEVMRQGCIIAFKIFLTII